MSFVLQRFRGEIQFEDRISLHGSYINSIKASLYALTNHMPPNRRQFFAAKYLEKLFEYSVSSFKLVPGNGVFEGEGSIPVWDISSLASLTRCVMDCYLSFIYLVGSPVSEAEFQYRVDVSNYTAECKRVAILETANPNSTYLPDCRQTVEDAKQRLIANRIFTGLPQREQNELLRAKNSMPMKGEDLARIGGINLGYYRSLQQFLSLHSHFYGYALSQFLTFDPYQPESHVWYRNCIDYLSLFMGFLLRDIAAFYPETEQTWEPEVRENIQYWNQYMADGSGEG